MPFPIQWHNSVHADEVPSDALIGKVLQVPQPPLESALSPPWLRLEGCVAHEPLLEESLSHLCINDIVFMCSLVV